ncbi:MAG: septum formation initiator family protein [Actinomycetota bacterium]
MAPRILNSLSRLGSRTRDVTSSLVRPTPVDQRIVRSPFFRWIARLALATVVVAGGTSLFFFPLMDFVTQRSAIAEKNSEFNSLADANEQLQTEVNSLQTPEGIRNAARAQLGYVLPGEQRLSLVPMPKLPTVLPARWPYTMVTDILTVRNAHSGAPTSPLAPLAP